MNGQTHPLNWDFILDKIKDEECLLVLGPEAYAEDGEPSLSSKLLEMLMPLENPNIFRYYPDGDFFLFDEPYKRTKLCYDIKSFYRSTRPPALLEKIVGIPFHVVLTLTPDKLLNQAFEGAGFAFQSGFYKKNKEPSPVRKPSKQNPLLYNVFGCTDSEESLILTHNDLYDYFKSIFSRKSMPDELKAELLRAKNIIFLGVPFERWYMQLLLRELEIHNQQFAFTRYAANQALDEPARTFCFEQFKIQFVPNNIASFVQELHRRCSEAGILRRSGEEQMSHWDMVRRLLTNGELDEALDLLLMHTENTPWESDVASLSGRFRIFNKRKLGGVLREEEIAVQQQQIVDAMLQVAQAAKSQPLEMA